MKTLTISALALSTLLTAGAVATAAAPSHHAGAGWTQARTGTWSQAPRAEYAADAYAYEPAFRRGVVSSRDVIGTDPDINVRLQLLREQQSNQP